MADESIVHCPLCGNKVPLGVTKCPVCATELQAVVGKRSAEALRSELLTEDFLHRELPKVELPEAKHSCPFCALELQGTESKCPRCGVPLSQIPAEKGQEMLECPECGSLAPYGSKSCPRCGIGFEEGPESDVQPQVEILPTPPERVPLVKVLEPVPPEAITPSATARASASQGLVNGKGVTNGRGLVNGTGITNGTVSAPGRTFSKRQARLVTRWQFMAILLAIVIVVPTFIYLSYSNESTPFSIDGKFDEWSHVGKFRTYIQASAAPINIDAWAVQYLQNQLFMYVKVEGTLLSSSDVSSFYMFVDADNDPTTGYAVSGIGAEYLLEVDGWNSSVQSTSLSEYVYSSDKLDWNSWDNIGSISATAVGSQMEAMATMPVALSDSSRFMLMSQNSLEQKSVSYTVPAKGGLLIVRQEPGADISASGIINQSTSSAIMRLRLTCDGAGGTVRSISSAFVSAPLASPIENIGLAVGEDKVVDVKVDTSGVAPGSSISASMVKGAIDSTFADVEIIGDGVSGYVVAAPSSVVIDGAFGDWVGKTTADSDSVPVSNPNIDMSAVGAVNDTVASYFYVSVVGEMCSGSYVPVLRQKPSGSEGGGVVIPSRKTGEDILTIYIDSDMSSSTGFQVSLASKLIGANYKLEVRGLNGGIMSRSLLAYSAGQWSYVSGVIDAAVDSQRLEISVSSASLNGASSIDYIIETTDWRARTDIATSVPQGTKALTGGILKGASLDSWLVDGSTTSSQATAMSYQRKLFYDGLNYWSFYYDGTNTMYKSSNNSGQTWSLSARAFSGNGIGEASVWYDSATSTVYLVGDNPGAASSTVHVRKGTVTKSPLPAISWSSNDQTPTVSNVNLAGKNTFISSDSSGFLWILTSNQTSAGRYDMSAFRSRTANTTTSNQWFCTGNMISPDDSFSNIKGSIVPSSGGIMWAVYAYSGNVAAREYTGTWSSESVIYNISSSGPNDNDPSNIDLAPPSVVIDGNGVVHVLYGNGHNKKTPAVMIPHVIYAYSNNGGASWNSNPIGATGQNVGNFYPTLTLDQSTGNVFAFWIESDVTGSYYSLICMKNTTGTWTALSLSSDTTYAKQYLTSVYSAPNEQFIAWQWTQNTTGTIEVQFDKIPEFQQVALPIFVMMGLFAVVYRRGRSSRGKDSEK